MPYPQVPQAEWLGTGADPGVKLWINPSHNVPGDTTAKQRLDEALAEYKRRIAGV